VFRSPIPERRAFSDRGQSLVEVVIALSVLVVVLVPALLLVTSSTKVVYNNQFKVTAANLANGQLEADRNHAVAKIGLPPVVPLPSPTTPQLVGSESYAISQQAGWCQPSNARPGVWTTYASGTAFAYGVLVTVTWPGHAGTPAAGSVQVAGILTTPGGTSPPSSPSPPLCPL
jgi:type II secretory pathway pseudopilin PulG